MGRHREGFGSVRSAARDSGARHRSLCGRPREPSRTDLRSERKVSPRMEIRRPALWTFRGFKRRPVSRDRFRGPDPEARCERQSARHDGTARKRPRRVRRGPLHDDDAGRRYLCCRHHQRRAAQVRQTLMRLRYVDVPAKPVAAAGPRGRPLGTLVLIHGFPLSAGMWEPQLTLAQHGWRVVAPHLRGFNEGPGKHAATSMDDFAGDIIDLLDALHIEQAVIGGLSMGGYITFALLRNAARY